MRPSILALALPLLAQAPAPKADIFEPVRFLSGDWVGESDGKTSSPSGAASFRFELEGKALVRRSHADYPAANGRPAAHHEDLMTVFAEGGQLKAFYVDNEGHAIRYLATALPQGVAFTSEAAPGPRFRLTYLRGAADTVTVRFEIAPPNAPEAFKTYLEGVTRKVK
ncbi:MAG TPA: hypothetical protein VGK03_00015 [Geothrix sp.]|jgi:hypothetical protein